MKRLVLLVAVAAIVRADAAFAAQSFWDKVAFPHRDRVQNLVSRAQAELDERGPGSVPPEAAARARALLEEALRLDPRHFLAAVTLGEALVLERRSDDAIVQFERACVLSRASEEEAWCSLRLGIERSKVGRYQEALGDYDRHIRLGEPSSTAYANAAEILMALGRLPEAQRRYREAIRIEEQGPTRRDHQENLALAWYGLAVAFDRDEQTVAAGEAVARALQLDAKMVLLDAAADPRSGVFFVPAFDVHYYRGLGLAAQNRMREASEAFRRFLALAPESQWQRRTLAHLAEIGGPGDARAAAPAPGENSSPARATYRVVAAATVHADGPIPAPLIDAAWKSQPGLVDGCFIDIVPLPHGPPRLSLDVVFDAKGAVKKVTAENCPAEWRGSVPGCLDAHLRGGLSVAKPSIARPTTARIQLVLSLRRQAPR